MTTIAKAPRGGRRSGGPSLDLDLYGREVLADPLPHYTALRTAGPAVWLPRNRLWAVAGYDDVKAALRAPAVFTSGSGVAANGVSNALSGHLLIASDGDVHAARRRVLHGPLSPRSLARVQDTLEVRADRLVDDLLLAGTVDGVRDAAAVLPVEVVADWVGLRVRRERMLRWGRRTFDALGPLNRLGVTAVPAGLELQLFSRFAAGRRIVPGGWAERVLDAARAGRISLAEARAMVVDLVVPSLDTTILASAELLWRLGTEPGLLDALQADPGLVPAAVVEAVRLASPIRGFTRLVPDGATVGGVRIPAGDRVVLLYAAANRDPARFGEPDAFSLTRPSGDQLGWGHGPHACVGMHLAKLEMQALLRALVTRAGAVTVDRPEPLRNNVLQGLRSFRLTVTARDPR